MLESYHQRYLSFTSKRKAVQAMSGLYVSVGKGVEVERAENHVLSEEGPNHLHETVLSHLLISRYKITTFTKTMSSALCNPDWRFAVSSYPTGEQPRVFVPFLAYLDHGSAVTHH